MATNNNILNLLDNRFGNNAYWVKKESSYNVYPSKCEGGKVSCDEKQSAGNLKSDGLKNLQSIANKSIQQLVGNRQSEEGKRNQNLLVFPANLKDSPDDLAAKDKYILQLFETGENEYRLSTGNVMGFIGVGKTQIRIKSRFAQNNGNDYFLQYMLSKVFHINLFSWDISKSEEAIFDLTAIMFPYFLKRAWKKGIFKQYRTYEYNDANVRGVLDINRHIRLNMPFAGKIAYRTREYSMDNDVTQLVRHTIEYLRSSSKFKEVLRNDTDTTQAVADICRVTENSYSLRDRQRILNKNSRNVSHPYFVEYAELQNICRLILQHGKLSYGEAKDDKKIYGVLFDGSWLWEEYIATVVKEHFNHYTQKNSDFKLFTDKNSPQIVPDYLSKDGKSVADAKYIRLDSYSQTMRERGRNMEIYYKTLVYMLRFNAKLGFLFYPIDKQNDNPEEVLRDKVFQIDGTDSYLVQLGLKIPQGEDKEYNDFCDKIREAEKEFAGKVKACGEAEKPSLEVYEKCISHKENQVVE